MSLGYYVVGGVCPRVVFIQELVWQKAGIALDDLRILYDECRATTAMALAS